MPWQLLDLDPDSATTKEVKRAYARLLKKTKPDQDPEGFKTLHEAYQKALYLVSLQENQYREQDSPQYASLLDQPEPSAEDAGVNGSVPSVSSLPESSSLPSRLVPPTMSQAFDALADALKQGSEGMEPLVRKVEACLLENPDHAECWGTWVAELIERYPDHAELRFKLNVLLYEAENQSIRGCVAVIHRLDRQGNAEGVKNVALYFLQNKNRIETEIGGYLFWRLGVACALWQPTLATKMSVEAFHYLPAGVREHAAQEIDVAQNVRQYIIHVPDFLKRFWFFRLLYPNAPHDWDSTESIDAIRHLLTKRAQLWSCYQTLMESVPEEKLKQHAGPVAKNRPQQVKRSTADHRVEDVFRDDLSPATYEPQTTTLNTIAPSSSSSMDRTPEWDKAPAKVPAALQNAGNDRRYKSSSGLPPMVIGFLVMIFLKLIIYLIMHFGGR